MYAYAATFIAMEDNVALVVSSAAYTYAQPPDAYTCALLPEAYICALLPDAYTYALQADAYFLLWSNLVLFNLVLIPGSVCKLYQVCKEMNMEHVEFCCHIELT